MGATKKPVLLKRDLAATIDEWFMAAEYIAAQGNPNISLCARGIRTNEGKMRITLDLSAIPVVKQVWHLPIIVDSSHATGHRSWVVPMARAGVAAGADGRILKSTTNPPEALSDGPQSLTLPHFRELVESLRVVALTIGRRV